MSSEVSTIVNPGKVQIFGTSLRQTFGDKIVGFHPVQSTTSSKPVMCSILEGRSCLVKAVAFSSDGKLVASGSFDGTVKLWDTARNSLVHVINNMVDVVAFSPDSKLVASSGDKTTKLWDSATGMERGTVALSSTILVR